MFPHHTDNSAVWDLKIETQIYSLFLQAYASVFIDMIKDTINSCRDWPIMLIFYPLCYAAVLTILAYYAQ